MVGDALTTVGWGRDDQDRIGGDLTQIDVTIRKAMKDIFHIDKTQPNLCSYHHPTHPTAAPGTLPLIERIILGV